MTGSYRVGGVADAVRGRVLRRGGGDALVGSLAGQLDAFAAALGDSQRRSWGLGTGADGVAVMDAIDAIRAVGQPGDKRGQTATVRHGVTVGARHLVLRAQPEVRKTWIPMLTILQFDAASASTLERLATAGRLPNLAALRRARRAAHPRRSSHPVRSRGAVHAVQRRADRGARSLLPVPVGPGRAARPLHGALRCAADDLGAARTAGRADARRRPLREPPTDRHPSGHVGVRLAVERPRGPAQLGSTDRVAAPAGEGVRLAGAGRRGVRAAPCERDVAAPPPAARRARPRR